MSEINVSLTDFMEFLMKAGVKKQNKVNEIMTREDYSPAFDLYKPLREAIQDLHQQDQNVAVLRELLGTLTDRKKINIYPELVNQYISFCGRREITWFEPPHNAWNEGDLSIRLNPELGLRIKDKNYIIKLYFKQEKLAKDKAELILTLLKGLNTDGIEEPVVALLDVCRKKLYTSDDLKADYIHLLKGEAANFSIIWNSLFEKAA